MFLSDILIAAFSKKWNKKNSTLEHGVVYGLKLTVRLNSTLEIENSQKQM